jgi:transglutaminase-like putative cysteine protease
MVVTLLSAAVLASGCLSVADHTDPDSIFLSAVGEYLEGNYRTASAMFEEAGSGYSLTGEGAKAYRATNWKFICDRATMDFPHTRGEAEVMLEEAFPDIPEVMRNQWLDNSSTEKIVSDGEVLYYEQFIQNIRYRNPDLIRAMMERKGHTPIFDSEYIWDLILNKTPMGTYVDPISYQGWGNISIPSELLPERGTLELWIPHPIATHSQFNVTILSVEPQQYVVKGPDVNSELGLVYLEVPLEEIHGDLDIRIEFSFSEYEMVYDIIPQEVGEYDKGSYEFIHYTRSSENIVVNQEIRRLALSIVGDETNPYLQAKRIYWYVVDNIPYSLIPHLHLSALGIPESEYVFKNGYGDCGAQSSFFCALCRSIDIPARNVGGHQLIPGTSSNHFWAEFLVPYYGWVPADVTVAEIADRSFDATQEERRMFKEFYFGHLDPYRFVIQKDYDVPMDPDPVNTVLFRTVHQSPSAACLASEIDLELVMYAYWGFNIYPMGAS